MFNYKIVMSKLFIPIVSGTYMNELALLPALCSRSSKA
ncbi:MAG: hypothetical protein IEMM0008_1129 [bacterium]|nr:MAG: hypothetical protein IEMM0008_1129 [bacterium]